MQNVTPPLITLVCANGSLHLTVLCVLVSGCVTLATAAHLDGHRVELQIVQRSTRSSALSSSGGEACSPHSMTHTHPNMHCEHSLSIDVIPSTHTDTFY